MKKIILLICLLLITNMVYASDDTADENWDIFMYVCGSNLEDRYHYWTKNMQEIQSAGVTPGLNFIQRFGGTDKTEQPLLQEMIKRKSMTILKPDNKWYYMEPRYTHTDMSKKETFSEFLGQIAPYQPKHKVLILWDHGGGSLGGIFLDKNSNEMLSINDLGEAFKENFTPDPDNPPFDIIIFNACLMNSIDVAKSLEGMTRYMIASEDFFLGEGLDYKAFTEAINKNPDISPLELSKIICDSYLKKCERNKTDRCATLSVIDMKKISKLDKAYNAYGEALEKKLGTDEAKLTEFADNAFWAEDYGGNTPETGFFNMVDLYGMAVATQKTVSKEAKNLQKAVTETVIHNVHGPYRKYSYGISTFFPFSGMDEDVAEYQKLTSSNKSLNNVYQNMLKSPFNLLKLFDIPLTPVGNTVQLKMDKEEYHKAVNLYAILLKKSIDGTTYYMGADDRIAENTKTYEITYPIPKDWFSLNGHLISATIIDPQQDYIVMSAPIKVNDISYNLIFAYDLKTHVSNILGLTHIPNHAMIAYPYMDMPKKGAKITIVNVQCTKQYGRLRYTVEPGDSFILEDSLNISNMPLEKGNYEICFRFDNILGISALSAPYSFSIK